jgi:hypothetical protein
MRSITVLHGCFAADGCWQLKGRKGIDAYLASRNGAHFRKIIFNTDSTLFCG